MGQGDNVKAGEKSSSGGPQALPIRQYAKDIVEAVKSNSTVVVIGETGSGKTTQLSQILYEAGFAENGLIAVTQPRRVAAVTVAKRVAEERGTDLGTLVGYAVRFEDCSCPDTRIKYLTDGTLLRECLEDPQLTKYSVVILDEAHERSLNTDILFGVVKQLVARREPPLKLIITSATLDGEKFSAYFNKCPVFNVPGRCFPVEIIHSLEDHQQDYVSAAVDTILQIHIHQPPGDILAFLTGQAEIDKAVGRLNEAVASLDSDAAGPLLVLPLYASLPPEMQVRVFRPAPEGVRRCIVATNVAETSITVEGVVYVVDSGVVKQKHYQPATGMDSLDVVPISRVGATQRAGRAGRTRPGKCFRLYTRQYFDRQMPDVTAPEIQRTSLAGAVLYLKSLDLAELDVLEFDFLDPPGRDALEDALRTLHLLDALDTEGQITPMGRLMADLPLDPALGRCLLAAHSLKCLPEMISIAAMLSTEHVFAHGQGPGDVAAPRQGAHMAGRPQPRPPTRLKELMAEGLGDHILLLRLWEEWEGSGYSRDVSKDLGLDAKGVGFARDIRRQLEGVMSSAGSRLWGSSKGEGGAAGAGSSGHESLEGDKEGERSSKRQRTDDKHHTRLGDSSNGHTSNGQDTRNRGAEGRGRQGGGASLERHRFRSEEERVAAIMQALTIGFAHKLARRLPHHNGYRTLGSGAVVGGGQLAQLHPSCTPLIEDDDGLLPEWVVYHELVSTSRPFLRQVCTTRYEYVAPLLTKIAKLDVKRLSRSKAAAAAAAAAAKTAADAQAPAAAGAAGQGGAGGGQQPGGVKRNDAGAVSAARERYLQRKASTGSGPAKKK